MVSIQEWFVIKSGLWWRAYNNPFSNEQGTLIPTNSAKSSAENIPKIYQLNLSAQTQKFGTSLKN